MFVYAEGKDSKNQRNLSQDTHLNCFIGITDFFRGVFRSPDNVYEAILVSLLFSHRSERSAGKGQCQSSMFSREKVNSPFCRVIPFVERARFLNTEHGNCYGHYYPKTPCLKRDSGLQTPSSDLLQSHESLRYEK